ncbi:hypothetical protein [Shinella zoogloeoides]
MADIKEILREANNKMASQGSSLIIAAAIFFALTFYAATKFGTTGI